MYRDSILEIFRLSWPMILICMVIVILMRIVYIIENREKIIFYKEVLSAAFIVYVMCLFYAVTFQDVSWSSSNFIPFKEMLRYDFGSKMFFKNVIGNMIMFIPLGFFTSYFLKVKKPIINIIMTFIISTTIELTQLFIGRVFDIDDIILNLMGGFIGFLIYFYIQKIKDKLPLVLQKPFIYNILIVVILVIILLYLLGVIYV